jgi:hypothetical protein
VDEALDELRRAHLAHPNLSRLPTRARGPGARTHGRPNR